MTIHPTAIIDSLATIGNNVKIKPFAIIERDVIIGDGCTVGAYSIIHTGTKLGTDCYIGSHVSLGSLPQDVSFDQNTKTGLSIGDNCVIQEQAIISRATVAGKNTILENDCYIMCGVHLGHDVVVKHHSIIAANAMVGGHITFDNNCYISSNSALHQFSRIGAYAFVAAGSIIRKDVLPFSLLSNKNNTSVHYRLNLIGMKRSGINTNDCKLIKKIIFTYVKNRQTIPWQELEQEFSDLSKLKYLQSWLSEKSRNGHYAFLTLQKNTT